MSGAWVATVRNLCLCTLLLVVAGSLRLAQCAQWNLVNNIDFHNNSYVMRPWHSHRHAHLNNDTTFALPPFRHGPDHSAAGASRANQIKIVVLAPLNSSEEYALHRIMPAILAAVRTIEDEARKTNGQKYLGGWERGAVIDFVDTMCNSAIGPLAAFEYYTRRQVDVFLGPVCPYVLAPVGRYTSYWDVPHLTSSGQAATFNDKNETFRILTRMNGSYSRMGEFFKQVSGPDWDGGYHGRLERFRCSDAVWLIVGEGGQDPRSGPTN